MRRISINYKAIALVALIMISVEFYLRDFSPNLLLLIVRDLILCLFISVVQVSVFVHIVFIKEKSVALGLFTATLITGIYVSIISLIVIYRLYKNIYLTYEAGLIIFIGCVITAIYFSFFYRKAVRLNKTLQRKIKTKS